MTTEVATLREMARQVAEITHSEEMETKRRLWARHNALQRTERPPVCCWVYLLDELQDYFPPFSSDDPLHREIAEQLQTRLLHANLIHDDYVADPWVNVSAVHRGGDSSPIWGLDTAMGPSTGAGGARAFKPELRTEEDLEKLRVPDWRVDEAATEERCHRAREILDGILEVRPSYGRLNSVNQAYWAACLRGLEQLMWDCIERPEWLHRLMSFLTEALLQHFRGLEREGHLNRNDNGGYSHCDDLPQPDFDGTHVRLKDTWISGDSQEFALVSPAMWDEFLLSYQAPLLNLGGLSAYGCCESLNGKLEILLRKVSNLRRVVVSAWTDLEYAVEQCGDRMVLQVRSMPSEVLLNWDEQAMREDLRRKLEIAGGSRINFLLEGIETVDGRPQTLATWTRLAKEVGAERYDK